MAFVLILASTIGTAPGMPDPSSPHSRAGLISDVQSIAPGDSFTVALHLQMEKGWHSYWKNPGASGEATSLVWDLPPGFHADSLRWPHPERIPFGSLMTYGYHDEVHLLTTLTAPDTLQSGTTDSLHARAEWMVCKKLCLPAHTDLSLRLPVSEEPQVRSANATAIEKAKARVPKTLQTWTIEATRSSGSYSLVLTPPDGFRPEPEGTYFFPAEKSVLDPTSPQPITKEGDRFVIALQGSEYAQEPATRLKGVLVAPERETWDANGDVRALRINVPVDSSGGPRVASMVGRSRSDAGGGLSLPWALLFAVGGGLLLNLMPCVFPVISIKILGFAQEADGNRRTLRRHGLLFAAGVLVSMWMLAGALLTLRAAGNQIGWGFQLQSPVFISLLTMLFFGIGLNLLGVFEVGTGLMNWGGRLERATSDEGSIGAFVTGILATVVATPCTAPFMGAAIGAALTLSVGEGLLVFTALGSGMATPYVLLSMSPTLLEHLPEPGAWMETLKQALSFPMFATSVWLVWVFGRQTDVTGVGLLLGALLLMSVAAWILYRWSGPQLSGTGALITQSLVFTLIAGAVGVAVTGGGYAPVAGITRSPAEQKETADRWQPFSTKRIEQARAQGRPIFVDFTAAWCLTCQVNKRRVLTAETVVSAFTENDVTLIRADWTTPDPEITNALESHGRSGVPLYVLYPGDGSGPKVLPEVLTETIVLRALEKVSSSS